MVSGWHATVCAKDAGTLAVRIEGIARELKREEQAAPAVHVLAK
jgi:5-(carboxyamino)imidazole ribonucleotide synthase